MGACEGLFIRGRRGVSDSQNASIGCLILIQSKPLIRNKILMFKIVVDAHNWMAARVILSPRQGALTA